MQEENTERQRAALARDAGQRYTEQFNAELPTLDGDERIFSIEDQETDNLFTLIAHKHPDLARDPGFQFFRSLFRKNATIQAFQEQTTPTERLALAHRKR